MVKGTHLKALGTIGTLKRALARMRDPVVQDHFASSSKRRTTHFTLKWLFSCMNPSVFLHIAFLRKTLATKVAPVKTIGIHNNNMILIFFPCEQILYSISSKQVEIITDK